MQIRYEALVEKFIKEFGTNPEFAFSSSGRTELGGNHTDHNGGQVLAASINLDTVAVVSSVSDYTVTVFSEGFKPICIDISDLSIKDEEKNTSASIIRGMAASIAKRGGYLGGFNAYVTSKVLPGSGLSSSASFEVLIGKIYSVLFNDDRFSTTEIAIMGRESENIYFGKPCGLMDQVACANGGAVGIDFKDSLHPVIRSVEADFKAWGYDLLIVNTPSDHADLTADYAAIPGEMKMVALFYGKKLLIEVDPQQFEQDKTLILKKIGNQRAISRATHFFNETVRAQKMFDALNKNDCSTYLNLVKESGLSSQNDLQNIGKLQTAIDLSNSFLKGNGVARVHGGGFAGAIQVYVPSEKTEAYTRFMEENFGKGCATDISIRNIGLDYCSI